MHEDKRLVTEMERSLKEWGVDRFSSRLHHDFYASAIMEAKRQYMATSDTFDAVFEDLADNQLPRDRVEAIKHVLRCEIQDTHDRYRSVVRDALGTGFQPFYEYTNQRDKSITYRKRIEYNKYSLSDLDPFQRFTQVHFSCHQKYMVYKWGDGGPILTGAIFEAMVACHVVYNEACFNSDCKRRGSLRWNGGRNKDSSWADLVCRKCHSTYEIKSKKNMEKVEKILEYRSCPGGSFRLFHANRVPNGKRFLVLVSRSPSFKTKFYFPLQVAEIDYAEPKLSDESFAYYGGQPDRIRITASAKLKSSKSTIWCEMPWENIDHVAMAKHVFDEYFGHGEWDQSRDSLPIKDLTTKATPADEAPKDVDIVEALKRSLKDLQTDDAAQDWEELYESESSK